jgi:shikimate kinase/RimJ/RimL family protein N-acetyltransferase
VVVLETERLLLRRLTESDVDSLVELDSDPRVMRFLTGGKPTPRAQIQNELLPKLLKDYDRAPGLGRWAAIEKATGEFLGWLALDPPEASTGKEAELGYRLRADAWGKGYATEGSRALIHRAFTELNLDRVWAETMAINTPSRRVLERVGLRHVRTVHRTWDDPIPGTEQGEVEYELRRDQYSPGMTSRGPVLVLIGPPGSGKTTIGQAIAGALGVEFRDTDADIEAAAGKPISDIFADDGEPVFRAQEERAVQTALEEHPGVLALGGGSVLSARTRDLLAVHRVAFLNVGLAEGVRRTGLSTARPLLAGINPRARFRELLEARLPLYREIATVEVTTDDRSPTAIATEIVDALGLVGST